MTTKTTYKVGDKVRILDASQIINADDADIQTGGVYEVIELYEGRDWDPLVKSPDGGKFEFLRDELKYIERVAEQVAKLKVGDKVKVISEIECGYGKGILTVTEGQRGKAAGGNYVLDGKYLVLGGNIELASPKPTKNQRIAALEQTVADLQSEVEALKAAQKAPTMTVKADVDVAKFAERLAKAFEKKTETTPNERRKAIIDEAKAFVDKYTPVVRIDDTPLTSEHGDVKITLNVNSKKRTVACIVHYLHVADAPIKRGFAKCAPDDVFNADIGKAIALGRALGLDVERFEKAVQPSQVVVGHVVNNVSTGDADFRNIRQIVKTILERNPEPYKYPGIAFRTNLFGWLAQSQISIIDDTEAQY